MADKAEKKFQVRAITEAGDWLLFTLGAVIQACFVDHPLDKEREKRSKWAGTTLYRLTPAISALLTVARAHPEEFERELAKLTEPISLEPMP